MVQLVGLSAVNRKGVRSSRTAPANFLRSISPARSGHSPVTGKIMGSNPIWTAIFMVFLGYLVSHGTVNPAKRVRVSHYTPISCCCVTGVRVGLKSRRRSFDSNRQDQEFMRAWYMDCALGFQPSEACLSHAVRSSLSGPRILAVRDLAKV